MPSSKEAFILRPSQPTDEIGDIKLTDIDSSKESNCPLSGLSLPLEVSPPSRQLAIRPPQVDNPRPMSNPAEKITLISSTSSTSGEYLDGHIIVPSTHAYYAYRQAQDDSLNTSQGCIVRERTMGLDEFCAKYDVPLPEANQSSDLGSPDETPSQHSQSPEQTLPIGTTPTPTPTPTPISTTTTSATVSSQVLESESTGKSILLVNTTTKKWMYATNHQSLHESTGIKLEPFTKLLESGEPVSLARASGELIKMKYAATTTLPDDAKADTWLEINSANGIDWVKQCAAYFRNPRT